MKKLTHLADDGRELCNVCCRPVAAPWRAHDERGRITLGCVSAAHDGHLTPLSESSRWHGRREAKSIRRANR